MISTSRFPLKIALLALAGSALLTACGKHDGKVYFSNLEDGAEIESPFTVEMRAENLAVEPATNEARKGRGHFVVLVNTPAPGPNDLIPQDSRHLHFGAGETRGVLDLPEGDHNLILLFARGDHRPYKPLTSQEIRVRVTRHSMPRYDDMDADTLNGPENPPHIDPGYQGDPGSEGGAVPGGVPVPGAD